MTARDASAHLLSARKIILPALLRVGEAVVVLVALATLVFLALRLLPGDPAALVLGDEAGEAERAVLRAKLHLDEPLGLQYLRFLAGLLTLDLGESQSRGRVACLTDVPAKHRQVLYADLSSGKHQKRALRPSLVVIHSFRWWD